MEVLIPANVNQHYIPSSYLKAWLEPYPAPKQDPLIWLFEKDKRIGVRKSPKKIFREADMYTIIGETGERNLSLEAFLGKLEQTFCEIRTNFLLPEMPISSGQAIDLLTFIAAMRSRTPTDREHNRAPFAHMKRVMDDLNEKMKYAMPDVLEGMSRISASHIGKDSGKALTYEDVSELAENPLQNSLLSFIDAQLDHLPHFDLAVFTTDESPGFITCDDPCVWHDEGLSSRPEHLRFLGLGSKTIEIFFPISPKQCILLSKTGMKGYCPIEPPGVWIINKLVRNHADKHFIVNQNIVKDEWF